MTISRRAITARLLVTVLAAIAIAAVSVTAYSGYFGGDVFVPVAANRSPQDGRDRFSAIFLSGDIGIRLGMGPGITQGLAAAGIPVAAVNSAAFFNQRRTPAEVTALIAAAIEHALTRDNADRVVLIGHSYGADMLQVGYHGLAPQLRAKVAMVGLIVTLHLVQRFET